MSAPSFSALPVAASGATFVMSRSIFGIEYESLIAGFVGGFIALAFMHWPGTRRQAALMVIASAALAGFLTPVALAFVNASVPALRALDDTKLAPALACLLGVGAHVAVPLFLRGMGRVTRRWIDGEKNP